MIDLGIC